MAALYRELELMNKIRKDMASQNALFEAIIVAQRTELQILNAKVAKLNLRLSDFSDQQEESLVEMEKKLSIAISAFQLSRQTSILTHKNPI